jgi:hypothetical protein
MNLAGQTDLAQEFQPEKDLKNHRQTDEQAAQQDERQRADAD